MDIKNITDSVCQTYYTSINQYLDKINNINSYVISTAINNSFNSKFDLIYKKSTILKNSNYQKIIGHYYLKSNSNIIYLPKKSNDSNDILYYYDPYTNTINRYFYNIISIKLCYSHYVVDFYKSNQTTDKIFSQKIKSNQIIDINSPEQYFITENDVIVYKNNIHVLNNQININFYKSDKIQKYNIYYEICYDVPYVLNLKKINYDMNLNIMTNSINDSNTTFNLNIEFPKDN